MAKRKRQSPNAAQKLVRGAIRDFINQLNGIVIEPEINTPVKGTEAWYRDELARELGGKTEVYIRHLQKFISQSQQGRESD